MDKQKILADWIKYKAAELKAKDNRLACEIKIQELYVLTKTQKSKTFNDAGFKTNISKNVKNDMDQDKYKAIRNDIPADLRPEKVKFELDVKGFDYLREHEKKIHKLVSDCVTVKTNKPTIKVEKVEKLK